MVPILKYRANVDIKNITDIANYTGKFGEIVKLEGTNKQYLMDGQTPGGFEISDDNTLTIEEIIELLNEYYVTGNSIAIKNIPHTEPFSSRVRSTHLGDGLRAGRFKPDKFSQLPTSCKIPDDYKPGTPLDFYMELLPDELDDDLTYPQNCRFGVHWKVVNPGENIEDSPETYKGFLIPIDSVDVGKPISVLVSNYSVINIEPNLQPGSTIIYRVFRTGNRDEDTYDGDIYGLTFGVRYIGSR